MALVALSHAASQPTEQSSLAAAHAAGIKSPARCRYSLRLWNCGLHQSLTWLLRQQSLLMVELDKRRHRYRFSRPGPAGYENDLPRDEGSCGAGTDASISQVAIEEGFLRDNTTVYSLSIITQ